jgi:hypothetical protein
VAGTVWAAWRWSATPGVGWAEALQAVVVYAVLFGAALTRPWKPTGGPGQ